MNNKSIKIVNYGIGENYLKDWGIQEALREIYQNFIDYGSFKQKIEVDASKTVTTITLSNDFKPNDYSFLKIGESQKVDKENSIGQHGEGLKMAFLIFLRLGYCIKLNANNHEIKPIWQKQPILGTTLALRFAPFDLNDDFYIKFTILKSDFDYFNNNLIKKKDIVYSHSFHGDIVDKPIGNIYSGKLFVCNLKNIKKSYNLPPARLKLDRDRKVPGSFEVSYHTSKINEAQAEINFVDQNYDDFRHVSSIPRTYYPSIRAKAVGENVEFIAKVIDKETNETKEVLITNQSIKEHLKQQSFFQKAINGIKNFIASKFGIKELLIKFRNNHCYSDEAKRDFDIILIKLGITLDNTQEDFPF